MKAFKTLLPLITGLLLTASCANDFIAQNQDNNQQDADEGKSLTTFAVEEHTTRTTGEYYDNGITDRGLSFYWTADDPLWVNKAATGTPDLLKSKKSNIAERLKNSPITDGVKRASKASFYFDGTFTAGQYIVRYTGKNGTKDKVTIKNVQTQAVPNDASHIGESGDCGTATANKQSNNRYTFMLDHKAAYMVFLPYNTPGAVAGAKLTKIKVTADKAISGEFNFTDSGIDINSRPVTSATNNSITLNLPGNFTVPKQADKEGNAAIMVIAPGTYSTFTVEYTLYDSDTQISGTITKKYSNVKLTAGLNKRVSMNLQIPVYGSDNYYMWDAAVGQHYWAGNEAYQPTKNNDHDDRYPSNSSDPRWFNTTVRPPSQPSLAASRSCADAPNINECIWYIIKGKPYWDNTYLWVMKGHLYNKGMWFKKLSVIATENGKPDAAALKGADYNGKDWRNNPFGPSTPDNNSILIGKPDDIEKYFFLPAVGRFADGTLKDFRNAGFYWLSTSERWLPNIAYNLYFTQSTARVSNLREKKSGCYRWTIK